jgi:hypothetical protein
MGWFKGKEAYTKTKALKDHRNTDLAVKCVIYRYFCNGLICTSLYLSYMSDTKCFNLCILLKYFMRELVPLEAVVKPELSYVPDLLGGQDLLSMHVHYDLDVHLVNTTSSGRLLVH